MVILMSAYGGQFKSIGGNNRLFVGILQSNVVLLQICTLSNLWMRFIVFKNS
jgi:hypothetical protein